MNPSNQGLLESYKFSSLCMGLGLKDLPNDDATHRLKKGRGSSISFITGHLLSERYNILNLMGAADGNPWAELFGGNADSREGGEYPDVRELEAEWNATAEKLATALENADEAALEAPLPEDSPYPVSDRTVRGALGFLSWHEAYHVGQLGILRTELGHDSLQALVDPMLKAELSA